MQLSLRAMVIAGGVLWGSAMLLVGLINLAEPNYGLTFFQTMSSVYPGFHTTHTLRSVLIGTIDGLVDGAVAALIFTWLYNSLTGRTASSSVSR